MAVISKLADPVKDKVNLLLANSVVATGKVVGGILLARDELLRVEELGICSGTALVDDCRLEVAEDGARDMLTSTSLREEGVEGIVAAADGLVRGHLAVWLDAVLKAVELPAGVSDLDTGLANVNRDNLYIGGMTREGKKKDD